MEVRKAFDRAVRDYGMLSAGDKVLVGASGGKDSSALAFLLAERAGEGRPAFELLAAHVSGGGVPPTSASRLDSMRRAYGSIGVGLEVIEAPAEAGVESCYRCAAIRRAALMRYAVERGFNLIALGHHLDDILATALMDLVERGRPGGMVPVRKYEAFGVTLIRPLAYIPEESLQRLAEARGWETWTCACPSGTEGRRAEFRRRLEDLTRSDLAAKRRLLAGLGLSAAPGYAYRPGDDAGPGDIG